MSRDVASAEKRAKPGLRTRLHRMSSRLNVAMLVALLLLPVASEAARKTVSNTARKADRLAVVAMPPLPVRRPKFKEGPEEKVTEPVLGKVETPKRATPKTRAKSTDTARKPKPDSKTAATGQNRPEKPKVVEGPAEPITEWPKAQLVQGRENCTALLSKLKIDYEWMPPIRKNRCGDPAPIRLKTIGTMTKVTVSPPASVNCNMAAALHRWMDTRMQPLAQRHLGSKITKLSNIAAYSCRNRYGRKKGRLSEHALANALDIAGFTLRDGRKVDLLAHWGKTKRALVAEQKQRELAAKKKTEAAAKRKESLAKREASKAKATTAGSNTTTKARKVLFKPERTAAEKAKVAPIRSVLKPRPPAARFLRDAFDAACDMFGTVLGPEANKAHENHFHLDLAPRRRKAYCE